MEMYNEGVVENTAMIGGTNVPTEPPSLDQHPELKRIRRFLLIFIGIDLVSVFRSVRCFRTTPFQLLCVVNFLFVIHSYAASDSLENQSPHSNLQLTSVIIGLIYYGFGLLVTYRYYQTGLLVVRAIERERGVCLQIDSVVFSMQYWDWYPWF